MRAVIMIGLACALGSAQVPAPGPLRLEVFPLAPANLETPYASPRDAARHRLQATLADLQSSRDVKAAIRGFADALSLDRTYAAAAWNLAIAAALEKKWPDAIAAMEEAARLDPGAFGKPGTSQVERLRQVAALSKTPGGQLKLQYDVALYATMQRIGKTAPAESMAALAEAGHLDPSRWEAPALLAGLAGDGSGYEVAAKFLEIALKNAADTAVRSALERAYRAAQRELSYSAARDSAEAATDLGEYAKAAELYENAWAAIPARAENGMDAAADWLAGGDTAHAAAVLQRLRSSGNTSLAGVAVKMMEEIRGIEPAVGQPAPDTSAFFRDAGFAGPPRIQDLLPRVDTAAMEVLARPLPRMVNDAEPVVLLAALDAGRPEGAPPVPLPQLAAPRPPAPVAQPPAPERDRQSAGIPGNARNRRLLSVATQPQGASIYVDGVLDPLCQSPCDIQSTTGAHELRVALSGFEDRVTSVNVAGPRTEVDLPLVLARGSVIVESPAPAAVTVNGKAAGGSTPLEVSLVPGLYRIGVQDGAGREQLVTVKPNARLRLAFKP